MVDSSKLYEMKSTEKTTKIISTRGNVSCKNPAKKNNIILICPYKKTNSNKIFESDLNARLKKPVQDLNI